MRIEVDLVAIAGKLFFIIGTYPAIGGHSKQVAPALNLRAGYSCRYDRYGFGWRFRHGAHFFQWRAGVGVAFLWIPCRAHILLSEIRVAARCG